MPRKIFYSERKRVEVWGGQVNTVCLPQLAVKKSGNCVLHVVNVAVAFRPPPPPHCEGCYWQKCNYCSKHHRRGLPSSRGLQIDVVYLCWPIAPSYTSPSAGGGGFRVSANEYSCAHHVTWSPNKLLRSTSIFNLCHISEISEMTGGGGSWSWDGILKLLWDPGIDSKELIPPVHASVTLWRLGTK